MEFLFVLFLSSGGTGKRSSAGYDRKVPEFLRKIQPSAPTENTMGNKERVYQSLELMAASYIACQNLTVEETCDLFHFNKIIAIFAEKSNVVLHAGDLLAQHPVVISASVCLYPLKFAIFGEVGETTTRKYLKEKFNLFQSVEEVSYDSATLLRALSLYTNKTIMFCEKLVCKYIQKLFTAKNNKWKDSLKNKHSGLYNVVLGECEEIFLQKITSIDATTMDLKWHSNISTDMALVKSSTQESTGKKGNYYQEKQN